MGTEKDRHSKLKIALLAAGLVAIAIVLYPFIVELCYKIFTIIMSRI
jgi:hypothetical protein